MEKEFDIFNKADMERMMFEQNVVKTKPKR